MTTSKRGSSSKAEDLDREMRAHLELEAEAQAERGLSADEAKRAAHRLFGNTGKVKEDVHEASRWAWWERLRQDVTYGVRVFRRSPAFAATAVLSLALGIGANTTMFNIINATMLRPLPVSHPETLIQVSRPDDSFSYPSYRALRDSNRTLSELFGASVPRPVNAGVSNDTESLRTKVVSGNYFTALGMSPAAGRLLTIADDTETVAVLSHAYWTRRFNASPDTIGTPLTIDGVPFTIVGVAPARFVSEAPGEAPEVFAPVSFLPQQMRDERGYTWLYLMGRLKPGATIEQARADLSAQWSQELDRPSPSGQTARSPGVTDPGISVASGAQGVSRLADRVATPMRILVVIVVFVLLIVCANLAALLLTRGTARAGEISLRLAIGATRGRLLRQLLTENVLLAAIGGAIGIFLAYWGSSLLVGLVSVGTGMRLVLDVSPDQRVLLFTAVVSIAAGLLFGLAPAWRTVRGAAVGLAESAHRIVGRERRWGLRNTLIVVQVALSFVLLAGSVMFLRTLNNLQAQDLGFQTDGVLTVQITTPRGYKPATATLVPQLIDRITALPGVGSASVAASGTLANVGGIYGLQFEGFAPRGDQDDRARADRIGPGYFRTAGIPLVEGREFASTDDANAQKVAIINETAARFYFGTSQAIGRGFTFNKDRYEIVGIAKDAKYANLRETTPRYVYFSLLQSGPGAGVGGLEVRTSSGNPTALADAVRTAIRDVDPRLNIGAISTLSERIDGKLGPEHLVADLTSFFSGLTLLLVSIGLYGTLAYAAARRTKELGLRMALGATRGSVVWMVLRDVVLLLGVGLTLGVAGALALGRLVQSILFGLDSSDATTLVSAVIVLTIVALAAGAVPALRAARLDPARVLRE